MLDASFLTGQPPDAHARLLSPRLVGAMMALVDVIAVVAAVATGLWARWQFAELFENEPRIDFELLAAAGLAVVAVNGSLGLYPGYGLGRSEERRVGKAWVSPGK